MARKLYSLSVNINEDKISAVGPPKNVKNRTYILLLDQGLFELLSPLRLFHIDTIEWSVSLQPLAFGLTSIRLTNTRPCGQNYRFDIFKLGKMSSKPRILRWLRIKSSALNGDVGEWHFSGHFMTGCVQQNFFNIKNVVPLKREQGSCSPNITSIVDCQFWSFKWLSIKLGAGTESWKTFIY